jgi:hypothetical protein
VRRRYLAGYLLLSTVALAAAVIGETIITRDNTKPDRPVMSAEFRLTPQSESGRVKSREVTAILNPGETRGDAGLIIAAWRECSLSVRLPGPVNTGDAAKEMIVDGYAGVWWQSGRKTHMQLYERKDGGLEWEICLDSQPPSNQFSFPIRTERLLFCYQGELTPAEVANGAFRPDSVIGSYAAYHTTRRHDWNIIRVKDTVREQYGTGKAFHIYRPKAHDADGRTVWCDLRIDTVLTITVPPDFLQTANYPVTIDPTFGYAGAGGTQTVPGTAKANINDTHTHVAGSGETITSFTVYASSGSGTQSLGLAAYTMDNGSPRLPVTRLAAAATVSLTGATPVWYTTSTVSQSLTSGTRYCVALGDGNANTNIYYDSYGSTARSNNATAALPATWSNNGTGSVVYSMYATYTVGSSATTPSRRRRTSFAAGAWEQKGSEPDETVQTLAENPCALRGTVSNCSQRVNSHCQQ